MADSKLYRGSLALLSNRPNVRAAQSFSQDSPTPLGEGVGARVGLGVMVFMGVLVSVGVRVIVGP